MMENRKRNRVLRALCLAIMAVCLIKIGQAYALSARQKAQQNELKEMKENSAQVSMQEDRVSKASESPDKSAQEADTDGSRADAGAQETEDGLQADENGEPVILGKYEDLHEENADFVGWISIEGTKIDYPVMQCEDDEYYLHHDFYGQDSKYGCLYVRKQADLDAGTNFVIYGHNMKDGSMFGELDLYVEEEFWREHPMVSFDTLYEERAYEIVAAFPSQVYGENDETFKYYRFYQADTQAAFSDFYENVKALSLYDTGVEAVFGDHFLTLSTCAYHAKDGRFVVVAKRVE